MKKHTLYEIDGEHYRIRRGKLVKIPDEWVYHTAHPQTIRKRKLNRKKNRNHRNVPIPIDDLD